MSMDCVVSMIEELRAQRPAVFLADEFAAWEASIGQVIASFPTREQRWENMMLVAQDLAAAMPGMPLTVACQHMTEVVLKAGKP